MIIDKLQKLNTEQIIRYIHSQESELDEFEENLRLEGKTLDVANREQAAWYAFYDQRKSEMRAVMRHLETEIARIRSKLYKSFTEGYHVDLGETAKNRYIDSEPEYLSRKRAYNEAEELYERLSSAVRAFEQRGYSLRNITQARVAAIEHGEL